MTIKLEHQVKLCPLFDLHDCVIEDLGTCAVYNAACPYDGFNKTCGIYLTMLKHKQVHDELLILRQVARR